MARGTSKCPMEVRSAARSHTKQAIKVLAGIMNQSKCSPAARVAAAQAILDRGWGKAVQETQITGPDGGPLQTETRLDFAGLTNEQLQHLLEIARAITAGADAPRPD